MSAQTIPITKIRGFAEAIGRQSRIPGPDAMAYDDCKVLLNQFLDEYVTTAEGENDWGVDPLHERARAAIKRLGLDGAKLDLAVAVFGWGSDEANGSLLGLVRAAWGDTALAARKYGPRAWWLVTEDLALAVRECSIGGETEVEALIAGLEVVAMPDCERVARAFAYMFEEDPSGDWINTFKDRPNVIMRSLAEAFGRGAFFKGDEGDAARAALGRLCRQVDARFGSDRVRRALEGAGR